MVTKIIISFLILVGIGFLIVGIYAEIGMRRFKKKILDVAEKSNLNMRAGSNNIKKVENEA